ncbi:ATP phosphoribosyltransferase [Methanocaldococcus infernus ME]|uniref:ATP phosphoribosyltransferase n=1 Tax=Methanocaldococcus infernus (strain DSM 11812 / JCM 15783 / ME) TaxID=573063 RepID=D5VS94_METIM|nr:ATP phosphoribosyltransferase [Methanocaldococcus infernus]ADG13447.1 ATP phosphoribosyltransferase [Methanocaldococcus infernus ME]
MILFALPNKGRISEPVMKILEKAGLKITAQGRSLFANTVDKDVKIMFARAKDIPEFVADGVADIGITGYDLVLERGVEDKVDFLLDFNFGFARLVLAAPENSEIKSLEDIKDGVRVATEFPNLTRKFFEKLGKRVEIIELSGATEIAPFIGVADIISDLTSTGTTLRLNKLREIAEIVRSTTRLIGNKESLKDERKRRKIEQLVLAIKSALFAETKKLIMMNAPKDKVEEIKKLIPGMCGPTVAKVLSNDEYVAIHAVVNEDDIYNLVPKLHELGARDILIVPIERIL